MKRSDPVAMPAAPLKKRKQSGVALLTVLLLVAVMSVLVMSMLDDIRFGLRRASNAQAMAQAQWYALGAESLAMARLDQLSARTGGRPGLPGDLDGQPLVFPIEHGAISARMSDASACFNLNSVVEGTVELWQRREAGSRQFAALLQALDVPAQQAAGLVDGLVDWIDSDQSPGPAGAEDATYLARDPAYRSSGALLAEVTELRAISGFDDAVYRRLRPHVCALPTAGLSPLNVNALGEDDAVLLTMLTDGALAPAAAKRLLRARPAAGWPDLDSFWAQPMLAGVEVTHDVRGQVALRSRFFALQVQVEYTGAQIVTSALLEHDAGATRLVARRLAPLE